MTSYIMKSIDNLRKYSPFATTASSCTASALAAPAPAHVVDEREPTSMSIPRQQIDSQDMEIVDSQDIAWVENSEEKEEGQQMVECAQENHHHHHGGDGDHHSDSSTYQFDVLVPEEIIFQILTFATDKDLIRCALVNRLWYNLVQHPLMYKERLNRLFINDDLFTLPSPTLRRDSSDRDNSSSDVDNKDGPDDPEDSVFDGDAADNDDDDNNDGDNVKSDHVFSMCSPQELLRNDIDWKTLYEQLRPSRWKLSKKRCGENLELSASGRHVRTKTQAEETNFSVQTTRTLLPQRNAFYFFECKIVANQRHNLAVGLADEHFKLRENFVGYASMGQNTPSWSYSSNGMIRIGLGGHGHPTVSRRYEPGDRVGLLIDLMKDNEKIIFFKNGESVGTAPLSNISRDLKYWPTITMYSRIDEVALCDDISCSFWHDICPLLIEHQGQRSRESEDDWVMSEDDDDEEEDDDDEEEDDEHASVDSSGANNNGSISSISGGIPLPIPAQVLSTLRDTRAWKFCTIM